MIVSAGYNIAAPEVGEVLMVQTSRPKLSLSGMAEPSRRRMIT